MSLADRYQKPDTRSRFEKWLDSLTEKNRQVVDGWLLNDAISSAAIVRMIAADDSEDNFVGYRANKDTISSYRASRVAR